MAIDINKTYRTRSGFEARIYATDGKRPFTVHGAVSNPMGEWLACKWDANGNYAERGGRESELDIFEVPSIDALRERVAWNALPHDMTKIAQQPNGSWIAATEQVQFADGADGWWLLPPRVLNWRAMKVLVTGLPRLDEWRNTLITRSSKED